MTLPHKRLGFIGMGRMGSHMVGRLLGAGHQVTVFDRSKEKSQAMAGMGASVAGTPRDLAANSEAVLVSVTDDAAVEQVMFGADGALAGLGKGSSIIDLSTVSPRTSHAAAEQMSTAAMAEGIDEDFSSVIRLMQRMSGVSDR